MPITFTAIPPAEYPVLFTETGLARATPWSVTLAGSTQSSTGSLIWFSEANGTYAFAFGSVPGYTSSLTSGTVHVDGAPQTITVAFAAISPTPPGPAAPNGYQWLAVIATGIAFGAVLFVLGWRGRKRKVSPRRP